LATQAQGLSASGDIFRSELKYYVVAGVLTIIFIVLFIFLFTMEKQIKQLEDKTK
jgi:uncharacterized membrane protein YhaH (DUF805 family)